MTEEPNGYAKLVFYRLDDLAEGQQRLEDKVEVLLIDVAMLKVKAGIWGAVAGAIPAIAAVVFTTVS